MPAVGTVVPFIAWLWPCCMIGFRWGWGWWMSCRLLRQGSYSYLSAENRGRGGGDPDLSAPDEQPENERDFAAEDEQGEAEREIRDEYGGERVGEVAKPGDHEQDAEDFRHEP